MPTGWRSEYLDVISKVVPKIWARTNWAMAGDVCIVRFFERRMREEERMFEEARRGALHTQ